MVPIKQFRFGKALSASALAVALITLAAPSVSHAEQFVLFDVMYTFTQADAVNAKPSKSHYYVRAQMNPMRPKDWTAPIDYRNGTVHVRTEVIDKPAGSVPMAWTLCYIPYKGTGAGYGCTNSSVYSEKGIYDRDVVMTTWWQNNLITWNQGIQGMDLVLKDDKGVFSHARPDPEHFFPQTVRITMVQVSAGATYDASKVPNVPPGPVNADAGASDAASASDVRTVTPDAATAGSGGTTGSGGSSSTGSGGATGGGGATASGGSSGSGGTSGGSASGTGGTVASTGGVSGGSSGPSGSGGASRPSGTGVGATSGCAVATGGRSTATSGLLWVLGVGLLVPAMRRRRRHFVGR